MNLRNSQQKVLNYTYPYGTLLFVAFDKTNHIFNVKRIKEHMDAKKRYILIFVAFVLCCFIFKAMHAEGLAHLSIVHPPSQHATSLDHKHGCTVRNRVCKTTPEIAEMHAPVSVPIPHLHKTNLYLVSPHIFFLPLPVLRQ